MANATDITGQKFSKLFVECYTGTSNASKKRMVLCRCECGVTKEMVAANLVSGMSKSCGCLTGESAKVRFTKHGLRGHPMYHRWNAMMQRCYNSNAVEYKNYGGRGIQVCDEWKESLLNYFQDMGLPPYANASIDRKCNDGNYTPENCRWATKKDQAINRRCTKLITHNGFTLCVSDWERKLGFCLGTLKHRLKKYSIAKALDTPIRKKGKGIL